MFFITYLRRELGRRLRQAIVIAIGLAIGVGLVVTVIAWSAGVKKAQDKVLTSLYGVGTDVTVTGKTPTPGKPSSGGRSSGQRLMVTPSGAEFCTANGKCHSADGETINMLGATYNPVSDATVADIARLHGVKSAAGGLTLNDNQVTIPKNFGKGTSGPPTPNSMSVDGVDLAHTSLGPLSAGTLTSGHSFTAADANSYVAVVDSGYATSHKLKVGSTLKIDEVKFTVIGIVAQPAGSSAADAYIPLARAQALKTSAGPKIGGKVNTIYVTAASAADIPAVQKEISRLLPHATVTTSASLASSVTGSLTSTAKLASDLGKWLAILVLIAAFAVASLLTLAAVSRRVAEFGTLKALGWRTRRIVGQVLGESVTTGIIGGLAGIGAGFGGAAAIAAVMGKLTAYPPSDSANQPTVRSVGPGGTVSGRALGGAASHPIHVPMTAPVTVEAIVLAVLLAIAGGLIAGLFASWRIAQLRPADALSRVA
jgi:putative ABC transport system permease protein